MHRKVLWVLLTSRGVFTYSFVHHAKFFEFLSQCRLLGVPGEAAIQVLVGNQWSKKKSLGCCLYAPDKQLGG